MLREGNIMFHVSAKDRVKWSAKKVRDIGSCIDIKDVLKAAAVFAANAVKQETLSVSNDCVLR